MTKTPRRMKNWTQKTEALDSGARKWSVFVQDVLICKVVKKVFRLLKALDQCMATLPNYCTSTNGPCALFSKVQLAL